MRTGAMRQAVYLILLSATSVALADAVRAVLRGLLIAF